MSVDVDSGLTRIAKVPRPPRPHPTYSEMVRQAIAELHDSSGSSKAAIIRYISEHYPLGSNNNLINSNVRLALKRGVERGELLQLSGSGGNGSFKLGEKKASVPKAKSNVNSEKTMSAKSENKGATSTKKPNIEKKARTPVKPTAKRAKTTRSPKAPRSTKPRSAKSAPKSTAAKQK